MISSRASLPPDAVGPTEHCSGEAPAKPVAAFPHPGDVFATGGHGPTGAQPAGRGQRPVSSGCEAELVQVPCGASSAKLNLRQML